MAETALTSILCPVCGQRVPLLTRDEFGVKPGEAFEPAPYYVTNSGTHDIENARTFERLYPDVFVSKCRVAAS